MSDFDTAQKEIWESTKRQAKLIGLCFIPHPARCDWLSDDGICVSNTGCMYLQSKEMNNVPKM